MNFKWIGAILIVGSTGGFGFSLAVHYLRESQLVAALGDVLDIMLSELMYKLTPLPELVRNSANKAPNIIKCIFESFADHLNQQIMPDASSCMDAAIAEANISYFYLQQLLETLGQSLGRFDLNGQISGLKHVQEQCRQALQALKADQTNRIRSYRILGLCAGISLAIFLI